MPLLNSITAVAAGEHSLALDSNGKLWAWGKNQFGQLGIGKTHSPFVSTPTPVSTALGFQTAKFVDAQEGQRIALAPDGTVWAWGTGSAVRLMGSNSFSAAVPTRVLGIDGVKAVASGVGTQLALSGNGTLWRWGEVSRPNQPAYSSSPAPIAAPADVVAIDAGWDHIVALTQSGTVWTSGLNQHGELGDGTRSFSSSFVQVMISATQPLSGIKAIAAGGFHNLALDESGGVWSWGWGGWRQLGLGTLQDSLYAQKIASLPPIQSIAAGRVFSLALDGNGKVWEWGRGFVTPVQTTQATGLTAAIHISAGAHHAVVVDGVGSVWTWNTQSKSTVEISPSKVAGIQVDPTQPSRVTAGFEYTMAVNLQGTLMAWGRNVDGELGIGDQGWVPQIVTFP